MKVLKSQKQKEAAFKSLQYSELSSLKRSMVHISFYTLIWRVGTEIENEIN